jgi:methylglutamate dehydrogenase subunit D
MRDPILKPIAAVEGVLPNDAKIRAAVRDGCGIALITARRGKKDEVLRAFAAHYGFALPDAGRSVRDDRVAAVAVGPSSWMAVADQKANRLSLELIDTLNRVASVVDQSDGYAVIRLSGATVPSLLALGASIDLCDEAFPVGTAATTQLAHINITFWRLPDDPLHGRTFELAFYRSFAKSVWHWLSESAGRISNSSVL